MLETRSVTALQAGRHWFKSSIAHCALTVAISDFAL